MRKIHKYILCKNNSVRKIFNDGLDGLDCIATALEKRTIALHINLLIKPVFTPLPKRDEPKAQSEARSWVRAAVLARVAGNC